MTEEQPKDDAPVEAPPVIMTGLTYREALTEVTGPARDLLEKWSGIPSSEVVRHVNDLRDRAYKVFPWASIGLYQFLEIDMLDFDCYPDILESIKKGALFLDLACCLAQEVRQVVADGAPAENVYGADLSSDLMNLGYDLFLDKDKLGVRFIQSDVLDSQSPLVAEFEGRFDVIHSSNFFHAWEWSKAIEVAKCVVKLLSNKPGSMILGSQVGVKRAKHLTFPHINRSIFCQSLVTWKELWSVVSQDTGIQFDVQTTESSFPDFEAFAWPEELEAFRVHFIIRRL
ncbi:hypothetical protein SNOG_10728 [Paecilomyces variotii No. 5]|uniref:Methyltransferase domain-containing protein n=1 Tax=Byssochlamys spectabilis (strain No. 5 / NBRC 109023) TaxID=1356009 RepID=V5FH78_BYSSN|nr:hypothetical protein SNOG_10728 [Paecilomyces variotii No. 5]